MAKITKLEADYVNTVKGEQCHTCFMWLKPGSCSLVIGTISPEGHCRYFELKKYKLPVGSE